MLDEGHKIKNDATQICAGMRSVQRQHALLLTGAQGAGGAFRLQSELRQKFVSFACPRGFASGCQWGGALSMFYAAQTNQRS